MSELFFHTHKKQNVLSSLDILPYITLFFLRRLVHNRFFFMFKRIIVFKEDYFFERILLFHLKKG